MHATTNLMDVQLALAQKYLSSDVISQYQCMRSQNQVMNNIRQLLEKKKPSQHSYDLANIQASSISHVNNTNTNFFDDSLALNKSKFTEEFQQSIIASALREVKQNCSQQTYETIKQYIQNSKIKEFDNVEKKVEKYREENQDFTSQIYILKLEKSNTQKQLERYKKMFENIDEEKKQVKKKIDYVLDKQNRIYKLQTSFAFKEKINLELKKRYERLRQNTIAIQKKVQALYHVLDEIWNNICVKIDSTNQCPQKCWKRQVMSKCKNQLMEQRKILKEQSAYIQKQYEVMNMVSSQFKKIFHQPEGTFNDSQKIKQTNSASIKSQSQKL